MIRLFRLAIKSLILPAIILSNFSAASAAGTLEAAGSATHSISNCVLPYAITVDPSGNVIVAGAVVVGSDYFVVKYDSELTRVLGSVRHGFGGNESASGVAADSNGNIIAVGAILTGNSSNPSNAFVVKFNPDLTEIINSTTYDSGGDDRAYGVVVDADDNIIVTGNGITMKYNANLTQVLAYTYNAGGGRSIALDPQGHIVVMGAAGTVKYDADFNIIASTPTSGTCVAVDGDGNIIVTGQKTIKYDPGFSRILSSVTHANACEGVTTDRNGNIIVAGRQSGFNNDFLTILYDNDLVLLSSATYNGGRDDRAFAVATDTASSIFVTGLKTVNSYVYCHTVKYKYRCPPLIASTLPAQGAPGEQMQVEITGEGFQQGASVTFGGTGIAVNSVAVVSSRRIVAGITVASDAPEGLREITVTNPGGLACTRRLFSVQAQENGTDEVLIDPSSDATVTRQLNLFRISMEIPSLTFGEPVVLRISTAPIGSYDADAMKASAICLDISNDRHAQPQREILLTIFYAHEDVSGLDESKLTVVRYDEGRGRWLTLPSTAYPGENRITVRLNHFSRFAVVEFAPVNGLSDARAFPNPFNPNSQLLQIVPLHEGSSIRIYSIAGELVRSLDRPDSSGRAVWDGKNDTGGKVASGVYLVHIDSPQGKRGLKVAVQK